MFQHALALHRQGKIEDAERAYHALLAVEPGHVDALVHLGALLLGQGRVSQAEPLLQRAAMLAPDGAEAHGNLAAALQALGRYEEAIVHYQHAVTLKPAMPDGHFGLAACLQALGRHEAAILCYQAVLAAEPAHPEAHFGLAVLFAGRTNEIEAMKHYRAAIAADPDFAEAHYGLGMLLRRTGGLEEAAGSFRQALDVDPGYFDAWLGLARTLQRLERNDEALAAYRAALEAEPDSAEAHQGLATVLCRKQREIEAIQHFERAIELEPTHLRAMAGLAGALITTGRHAEAIELCRRVMAINPDFARAKSALGVALAEIGDIQQAVAEARGAVALAPYRPEYCYVLVQLAKVRRGDPVVDALEAMLPRAGSLSPREQCWLHFGLAKAYEDLGDRDRGFDHLLIGNAIKRRQTHYPEAMHLQALERIQAVFTAEMVAGRRDLGDPDGSAVFIVGMPRSGTTLVEQILASHKAVFGAGERPELQREVDRLGGRVGALPFPESMWTLSGTELRQMGATYVDALRSLAPDRHRIVDKMPLNFIYCGLIHLMLPNARIIHVVRDPVDTCLSCFSKLFSGELPFAYDLAELGRFHRAYQGLMAHWRTVLPAHVLLEVHYERLVDDLGTQVRRIVGHCGLDWDDSCLEFHKTERPVHTASVTQVRQPIYRSSVGRWRPDAALLQPLVDALGDDGARA